MNRLKVMRAALRLAMPVLAAGLLWACAPGDAARTITPVSNPGCEDGTQPSGAAYRICMPQPPVEWNGGLVVYAHGYVAPTRPPGLSEDQLVLPDGTGVDELATQLG